VNCTVDLRIATVRAKGVLLNQTSFKCSLHHYHTTRIRRGKGRRPFRSKAGKGVMLAGFCNVAELEEAGVVAAVVGRDREGRKIGYIMRIRRQIREEGFSI
jgi:hypothetical protein